MATEQGTRPTEVTMEEIVALCKRRGFVFPSSEIYGGLGSTYDYGHYGVLLDRLGDPPAPARLGGLGPPRGLHRPARPVPRQVQAALA
jgi:hypothetical protein